MGKALLIIDVLNEFVYGAISGEHPEGIVANLVRLIRVAQQNAVPVVFCKDEHLPVDRELTVWGEHAMKGLREVR